MRGGLHALAGLVAAAACAALVPSVAEASFPGRNGLIAVSREGPPFEFKPHVAGAFTLAVVNPRSGRARPLTRVSRRCVRKGWTWEDFGPSYSASGRLLTYFHDDSCDPRIKDGIYVMRADGSRPRLIREMSADEADVPEFPAFSPSGEFLAFDQYLGSTYIMRVKRGARERDLSDCPERRCPLSRYIEQAQPAWSPTGRRLALTLGVDGESGAGHIGSVDTRGLNLHLVTRSRRDAMPDWSPTGDRIVFRRGTGTGRCLEGNVFTAPAHARRPRPPKRLTTTCDAFFPIWSPNRRSIAYVRDLHLRNPDTSFGRGSLWIMRADGRRQRLVTTGLVIDRISWQPRPRR
jgi:Tol biopolymer transport system component